MAMKRLPLITALGGINAAGRSSGHHGYRRMIFDALSDSQRNDTLLSLAGLTGRMRQTDSGWVNGSGVEIDQQEYLAEIAGDLQASTLIRQLENNLFNPQRLVTQRPTVLQSSNGEPLEFTMRRSQLPTPLPHGWELLDSPADPNQALVRVNGNLHVSMPSEHQSSVNSAGQLPSGFDPATLYASRNHPRALQLTVFAASDALNSLGLDWDVIRQKIPADQIGVLAGSGMGQLDYNGFGGMLQARLLGKKVTSKQLPLGYAEMPADFINAYLLGNLGTTGTNVAACATFLYNLRQAARDIQSGTHRVVIVGNSEAPLVPEIFEGFANMGALADDAGLAKLDGLDAMHAPDYRRACRPFGDNCGFTLAESAQCIILMDDELALELGANVLGAVNDIFINADGFKKSIASPGLGNYLSMAKATAATRLVLGDEALKTRTFVQAHGTGTPQNRITESHILSEVARTYGISNWPVTAIKTYIGHSLATSAGDQLAATLGIWSAGIIPGITNTAALAEDVTADNLDFLLTHKEVGAEGMDAAIINSKGFGGNNASASILAPHIAMRMLGKRHGKEALTRYQAANEPVRARSQEYDTAAKAGVNSTIYKFDNNVLGSEHIEIDQNGIRIKDYAQEVSLHLQNNYDDMCDD